MTIKIRLPARFSNKSSLNMRLDCEIQLLDDLRVRVTGITKVYVFKLYFTLKILHLFSIFILNNLGFSIQDLKQNINIFNIF